jgi:hypothetical protein
MENGCNTKSSAATNELTGRKRGREPFLDLTRQKRTPDGRRRAYHYELLT